MSTFQRFADGKYNVSKSIAGNIGSKNILVLVAAMI